mgnify:FL=1
MKKVFTYILKLSARFLLFLFEMVLFFIALFAILTAVESCSPDVNLDKDMCFDDGNVWDYDEDRCRDDCLLWNDKYGCVQMTPEHRKFIDECYEDWQHCDREQAHKYYLELCEKYKVPIDPKTGECYFD